MPPVQDIETEIEEGQLYSVPAPSQPEQPMPSMAVGQGYPPPPGSPIEKKHSRRPFIIAGIAVLALVILVAGVFGAPKKDAVDKTSAASPTQASKPAQAAEYAVTFKDGDTTIETKTVTDEGKGATVNAPAKVAKDGYLLEGWTADADGSKIQVKESKDGTFVISHITGDTTLNAQWAAAFTVVFTDGEGNELAKVSVKEGGEAKAPSAPKLDGYTFTGWDADFTNVTGDLTVNATWKALPTKSQSNAVKKAKDYLSFMAFSYDGLIDQLEYEKFSYDDAVYGVDNCGADWNEQAAKKAEEYLDFMSFSRDGLIEQLQYEGFTYDQAAYGVDSVGL
ncbi:Ltp family lipoprotein [Raoultibacter timonensis]|uniref:Ltp family lipoprotein n=1 Tax=Raoultibacter timonensis TaxID=1907662 RepID=UPI0026DC678F|nr:Ltp family lipoprotein [Raoultibacter timonensis]